MKQQVSHHSDLPKPDLLQHPLAAARRACTEAVSPYYDETLQEGTRAGFALLRAQVLLAS
ncbi:hypothetical protein ABZ565_31890 [Streptomyces sp. NPDC016469]|uniref:hypothetical protein n=1 Tax=Streptomyces sp. NPDC016469 TaxID=3157191 RepID=UPI0034111914